ncbi:unnamed protein product [Gordionus sp. m RMFG-2023]
MYNQEGHRNATGAKNSLKNKIRSGRANKGIEKSKRSKEITFSQEWYRNANEAKGSRGTKRSHITRKGIEMHRAKVN